jgi:hypothetical protein
MIRRIWVHKHHTQQCFSYIVELSDTGVCTEETQPELSVISVCTEETQPELSDISVCTEETQP